MVLVSIGVRREVSRVTLPWSPRARQKAGAEPRVWDRSPQEGRAGVPPAMRLLPAQAERQRRMHGEDEGGDTRKPKHLSADDLNDGFVLDKDDRRLLSYTVRGLPSLVCLLSEFQSTVSGI